MSKDGGPAFPDICAGANRSGMTLRDYFAAHAMAFCSAGTPEARARQAYEMADAMLAAREGK